MDGEKVPAFSGQSNIISQAKSNASAKEMVEDLLNDNQAVLNLIIQNDFSKNPIVEALLQDRMLAHKKAIWFLKSILS